SAINLRARSTERDVGEEVDCAIISGRMKFQGRVRRQHAVADSEHAVVAQGRDFDDITMRINGVARARPSQVNLAGIASVADVNRSAISAKSSNYFGAAIGTGCQNGHFATGARRSRVEQGEKLAGVGNINRNTTWFSVLKSDVLPVVAVTP